MTFPILKYQLPNPFFSLVAKLFRQLYFFPSAFQLNKLKIECKVVMLPSPSSSLSSFRDYYHHTSENSDYMASDEEYLTVGLRNFKLVKLFSKCEWKIKQRNYWLVFLAFKKITYKPRRSVRKKVAEDILKNVLTKMANRESKVVVKQQYLQQLLNNMKQERQRQIDKMIKFGLKFIKRNYLNLALSIHKFKHSKERKARTVVVNQEKARYVRRVSKITLYFLFRNISLTRLSNIFQYIKGAHTLRHWRSINQQQGQNKFLKFKKQKQIYVHVSNNEVDRQSKLMDIGELIKKKVYINYRQFWFKFNNKGSKIPSKPHTNQEEDNPEIFLNATRHMIYLTEITNSKANTNGKDSQQQERALKLMSVLKSNRLRQKISMSNCILAWRRTTNQYHLLLRKEILRLEQIKQHYMEDY